MEQSLIQDGQKLCHRCSNIDLKALLQQPYEGPILGRIAQSILGTCSFCDFFFALLPDAAKEGKYKYYSYRLRSTRARRGEDVDIQERARYHDQANGEHSRISGTWPAADGIVLQLDPVPHVMAEIQDGPGIPRILCRISHGAWFKPLQDCIDFSVPCRWLDLCSKLHTKKCCLKLRKMGPSNLIDCFDKSILPAKDVEYVTLSYVWGVTRDDAPNAEASSTGLASSLPKVIPKTIEDAITVTLGLGYRYLWVDKYCIPQDNTEAQLSQIQRMDIIYRNSAVTLIDATGQDPYGGLPGVRPNSRSPHQPSIRIGDVELVSTMLRPEWHIQNSAWSTRAWTFQEGLLSRRRLIFTPQQLYFECQGLYCSEALAFPDASLQLLHTRDHQQLHKKFCRPDGINLFPFGLIGRTTWEIYRRVTEYSIRSLTRDDDILNGIIGLFRHTETMRFPMHHLWGLPFQKHVKFPAGLQMRSASVPRILGSFRWYLKEPSKRRQGFPSWSWTGWFGEILWPDEFNPLSTSHSNRQTASESFEIEVETMAGTRLKFHEFQKLYYSLDPSSTFLRPCIRITANMVFVDRMDPEDDVELFSPRFRIDCVPSWMDVNPDAYIMQCQATTTEYLDTEASYLAIHISTRRHEDGIRLANSMPSTFVEFLLVMNVGEHWERVALAEFSWGTFHMEKKQILLG